MNKKFIVILASAALLTACQKEDKEEISSQYKTIELYATIEQPGSTGSKTVFGDTDNKTYQNLKWDGKEEILVIDEKNHFAKMVYDSSPDGKITAKFINMDPLPDDFVSIKYAFYPYESFIDPTTERPVFLDDKTIVLTIKSIQKNVNNIASGVNPSFAKVDDVSSSAVFKNICGILKFKIDNGSGYWDKLTTLNIELSDKISGSFSFNYTDEEPDLVADESKTTKIISAEINETPWNKSFYFIVPPKIYTSLIISAKDQMPILSKIKTDKSFAVHRSYIIQFPTLYWVGDSYTGWKLSPDPDY